MSTTASSILTCRARSRSHDPGAGGTAGSRSSMFCCWLRLWPAPAAGSQPTGAREAAPATLVEAPRGGRTAPRACIRVYRPEPERRAEHRRPPPSAAITTIPHPRRHGCDGGHGPDRALARAGRPPGRRGSLARRLARASPSTTDGSAGCSDGAPVRGVRLVALAVDITLNRYGDHDPDGRMYALASDVECVRAAERRGADGVSIGLQGDAIQPLVLRVLPGECLRVCASPTSSTTSRPASTCTGRRSWSPVRRWRRRWPPTRRPSSRPASTVTYEWMVAADEPEGTHCSTATATSASRPTTASSAPSSSNRPDRPGATRGRATAHRQWDAVVQSPGEPTFREFVLFYHEIGDENYRISTPTATSCPWSIRRRWPTGRVAGTELPQRAVHEPPAARPGDDRPRRRVARLQLVRVRRPGDADRAHLPRRPGEAAGRPRRLGGLPRAPRARRVDPLAAPARRRADRAWRAGYARTPS